MTPSSIQESPLYPIANPKSIAFFGASNSPLAMGTNILRSILSFDYAGTIYPIHPKEEQVQNINAFQHVSELPHIPDIAFIVLPTTLVSQTLEACGKKGIRHAVIVSAGFTEVGGQGSALQEELIQVAKKYGIRFLGPNCIGMVNSHLNLNATFLPYDAGKGFIGMASQSGSFITQMFSYMKRFGIGFSTGFSVGNQADINFVECLNYLGACPNTKVIALYIESIKNGRAFIDAARAIVPHKPIVAVYIGGSEEGRKAGLSHTGALAGPDALYNGVFRQSGIIRADSIEELFDFCMTFGMTSPAKGNRAIIQTHSGGPGAAAADACGRNGIKLPQLSSDTLEKLKSFVPHTGSVANPVDLTFTKNPLDFFQTIPTILLEDKNMDGLLIYFLASTQMIQAGLEQFGLPKEAARKEARKIITEQTKAVADLNRYSSKPIIGFSFLNRNDSRLIRELQDSGVPILPSPERGARAMSALITYQQLKEKLMASI